MLKDRAEAEIGDGVFEVGIEPFERSHVRVGDIFHREGNPFFPLAERSHRMPEFISIENDEVPWLCDQLKMFRGFHRIILKQFTDQFALRRPIDKSHQNRIASPFIVRGIIVKTDMVPRFRIVVEGAGMGVALGTETELGPCQAAQEFDEGPGSIEMEKARGLLHHRIVADAPTFFMAGNIVAIQLALHPLRLRYKILFHH